MKKDRKTLFSHDYVGKIHQETKQVSVILLNKLNASNIIQGRQYSLKINFLYSYEFE